MGKTVEELFDLALAKDAEAVAKVLVEEEKDRILDVLWALSHYSAGSESRGHHLKMLITALGTKFSKEDMLARLPESLLTSTGKIDAKSFADVLRKRGNTRHRKWITYDLKEEEAEGFCKLWAFFLHDMNKQGTEATVQFVQACIGSYNLYPHRCVDLLLTAWEYLATVEDGAADGCSVVGEVIERLGVDVVEVVGFRYLHHHIEQMVVPSWAKNGAAAKSLLKDLAGTDVGFYEKTPRSLHTVAGALMKRGLLYYSDLVPYLQPTLDVLQKETEDYISKKLSVCEALGGIDKKGVDADYANVKLPNCYKFNDHYGLILGVLHSGAYDIAASLLDGFKDLQPMTYPALTRGIAAELAKKVDAVKLKIEDSAKHDDTASVVSSVVDELESIAPILSHLGHRLSKNLHLFSSLVQVLLFCGKRAAGKEANLNRRDESDNEDNEDLEQEDADDDADMAQSDLQTRVSNLVVAMGTRAFLPALAVMTGVEKVNRKEGEPKDVIDCAPPSLSHNLWDLFRGVEFRERFKMYEEVANLMESSDFELQWADAKISEGTARVLRRLTHDSTGELAKRLAKLSHSSPLVLFNTIFRHVMNYGMNIIPEIVDALKNFAPLSLDVMTYRMISYMSDTSKPRVKPDKVNLDDWLSNLGHFTAAFYKKHANKYDVRPMLHYMLYHARTGRTHELVVLKEMLQAALIDSSEDLSDLQLALLEAGPVARLDCSHLHDGKTSSKQQARLSRALKKELVLEDIANNSVLALAKIHSNGVFTQYDIEMEAGTQDNVNLRMVKEEQARVTSVLMQIVHFVELNVYGRKNKEDPSNGAAASSEVFPFVVKDLVSTEGILPAVAQCMSRHKAKARPVLSEDAADLAAVYGADSAWVKDNFLPSSLAEHASGIDLYLCFWSLSLRDLCKAEKVYSGIVDALNAKKDEGKDQAANQKLLAGLEDERRDQEHNVATVSAKLKANAKLVIASLKECDSKDSPALAGFFQACLWPRIILQTDDAVFCARFLSTLHSLGLSNVSLIYAFVCRAVPRLITCCTNSEVQRASTFLRLVLSDWHSLVKAGKATKELREPLAEGHAQIARSLMRTLCRTDHQSEMKQAFEVLRGLQSEFPMHETICNKIEEAMSPMLQWESDLHFGTNVQDDNMKAPATSYLSILKKRKEETLGEAFSKISKDYVRELLGDRPAPEVKEKREKEASE
eukprot:gene7010-10816_t